MADEPSYRTTRWTKHFEEIDKEIVKYALLCKVKLLDPGVLKRVLNDDATVCGAANPAMFRKLRSLLMMHYSVREKAVVALGPQETLRIVDDIVARLRDRFGSSLGTPDA
jgi:hypothetical protein